MPPGVDGETIKAMVTYAGDEAVEVPTP